MVIRNEHRASGLLRAHLLARSFVIVVGCLAVSWGVVEFPVFWQESSLERVGDRIIAGAPFKPEIIARQSSLINSIGRSAHCRPAALRGAAIVRLRMVEAAISENDRDHIDEQLKILGNVIRSSLACSPADPFLWIVLFWMENAQSGADPSYLKYLRMSYHLGPNEGWIAIKRNPIVLANLASLPPDLAEAGISEFVALVRSHFYSEAGDIVAGLDWPTRVLLFARLREVNEVDRQTFAKLLHDRGLDNTPVPGTAPTR
jgi:hypothetical protein